MVGYTRLTSPDFKALVLTYTRFGFPSTKMRTFCRLAPHFRLVLRWEWLIVFPVRLRLPVTKQRRAIFSTSLSPNASITNGASPFAFTIYFSQYFPRGYGPIFINTRLITSCEMHSAILAQWDYSCKQWDIFNFVLFCYFFSSVRGCCTIDLVELSNIPLV